MIQFWRQWQKMESNLQVMKNLYILIITLILNNFCISYLLDQDARSRTIGVGKVNGTTIKGATRIISGHEPWTLTRTGGFFCFLSVSSKKNAWCWKGFSRQHIL